MLSDPAQTGRRDELLVIQPPFELVDTVHPIPRFSALDPAPSSTRTRYVSRRLGGAYALERRVERPERSPVASIIASGAHFAIVRERSVEAHQEVDVFDAAWSFVRTCQGLAGDWAIDPRGPVVVGTSREGVPTAWPLQEPAARTFVLRGRLARRVLRAVCCGGDMLFLVAFEPRRLGGPSPNIVVSVVRVPSYERISDFGSLRGTECLAEGMRTVQEGWRISIGTEGILLADDDALWWTDWHLSPVAHRPLRGVRCVALSAAGPRGHMMLAEGSEGAELWFLARGQCRARVRVSTALLAGFAPPVCTPDGGVVLVTDSRIEGFDAEGRPSFRFGRRGPACALVDAQGTTIFTHERRVVAVRSDGTPFDVWTGPEGAVLGPLAAFSDRLVVGDGSGLFVLAPT